MFATKDNRTNQKVASGEKSKAKSKKSISPQSNPSQTQNKPDIIQDIASIILSLIP
jgi:hypothetical protein